MRAPLARLLGVGALTLAGFLLRLSLLDQGLFGDELWTYDIVTENGVGGVLTEVYDSSITPPLHYLLAWAGVQLGDPAIAVRLPSLLLGTATIPVAYLLGRRASSPGAGLLAAAIVALGPLALFYSTEARAYAALMFLVALSTLALLRAIERGGRGWWIAYAAAACAALYTHYTAAFAVGAQGAWALWAHRERLRPLVAANAAICLGFLPWLPGFLEQSGKGDAIRAIEAIGSREQLSLSTFLDFLVRLLAGHPFIGLRTLPGSAALVLLAVAAVVALVAAIGRLARTGPAGRPSAREPIALMLILAAATPAGLLLVAAVGPNLYIPRNMSASMPALAVVLAALVHSAGPRLAPVLALLVVGALGIGTVRSLDADNRRPAFREVAEFLEERAAPGDPIVDESRDQVLGGSRPGVEGALSAYLPGRTILEGATTGSAIWRRASRGGRVHLVRLQIGVYVGSPPLVGPGRLVRLRGGRLFAGFVPLAVSTYRGRVDGTVERRGGREIIDWSLGCGIVVTPAAARGAVERTAASRDGLSVRGWATDADRHAPADGLLAFSDGRLVATGRPNMPRPDVARGSDAILFSGFELTVPSGGRAERGRLRVFATVGRRASELSAIGPNPRKHPALTSHSDE